MAKRRKSRRPSSKWREPLVPSGFDTFKSSRILSLDPGVNNFGIAVSEYCPKRNKFSIVGTNLLQNTIREPKVHLQLQKQFFQEELKGLIRDYGPFDLCIAERYQSRSMGGNAIESINIMLGIILCTLTPDTRIITAATWKNAANRSFNLDDQYERIKKQRTPHELDALLIGIYRLSQVYGLKEFSFFNEKGLNRFIQKFLKSAKI